MALQTQAPILSPRGVASSRQPALPIRYSCPGKGIHNTPMLPMVQSSNWLNRQFKVIEKPHHPNVVCGRATIARALCSREINLKDNARPQGAATRSMHMGKGKRKADEMDKSDPTDFVLKVTWCDPERRVEDEVMGRLQGTFGPAQHVWHCDVFEQHLCSPEAEGPCSRVDEAARVEGLQVCNHLTDIAISVPADDENGNPPELKLMDKTRCHSTSGVRMRRMHSYILMSSIGVPLSAAKSPRQFMTAVLDAILGYWRLFNLGVLHRDISEGNVMILEENQRFARREWEESREEGSEAQDEMLAESEKKLQEVLARRRNCKPTGMLSDFDLHAIHSHTTQFCTSTTSPASRQTSRVHPPSSSQHKRLKTDSETRVPAPSTNSHAQAVRDSGATSTTEPDQTAQRAQYEKKPLIDFRTGTTAFMSIRVLGVRPGKPYAHSFLDDLESFFWVIVWSAAAHLDSDAQTTDDAQIVLNSMSNCNLRLLMDWKLAQLSICYLAEGAMMVQRLDAFENGWASDHIFTDVIVGLGGFFSNIYNSPKVLRRPAEVFSQVVDIVEAALSVDDSE